MRTRPQGMSAARVEGEVTPTEASTTGRALRGMTSIPSDYVNEVIAKGATGLLRQGAGVIKLAGDNGTGGTVGIPEIARAVTAPVRQAMNTSAN